MQQDIKQIDREDININTQMQEMKEQMQEQMQEIDKKLIKIEFMLESQSRAKAQTYINKDDIAEIKRDTIENTKDIKELTKNKEDINQLKHNTKENTEDLEEMRNNNKWLFRTVVGAVILELMGIIIWAINSMPMV